MASETPSEDRGLSPRSNSQLELAGTSPPAAVESCVHYLINKCCEEQPEATAVSAWNGDFTYQQLSILARSLGALLSAEGVGPEVFVPIYFEKSRWIIVAMLGVLQAGGAFVLLDPSHPIQRLEGICQTLKAQLVVSSSQNAPQAGLLAPNVVVVDEEAQPENRSLTTAAATRPEPSNAAYAMFTSGSTGSPKGVVIEHRSISSSTVSHGRRVNLTRTSRVLQFASYAFDACLLETLTVLVQGGCVCIPSEAERRGDLVAAMSRLRVNWACLTPSLTRLLDPNGLPTLETLVLGGEAMNKEDRDQWAQHVNLMNAYGPTECSIVACVNAFPKTADAPVRIGRPAGGSCWIVDENDVQSIRAVGQIGELLIEGPIVGRGYMGDDSKTAAAFIDRPDWLRKLWPGVHGKVYKTGDLARCYPDGSIEFLGRKDNQLKVRGQRMEAAEIEFQLRSHLAAMDVAVDVVQPKDDLESTVLTAFVVRQTKTPGDSHTANQQVDLTVPDEDFQILVQQAKSKMRQVLPSSMIPTVFLTLPSMPLTTSGKLDRRSLRQLGSTKTRRELLKLGLEATVTTKPRTVKEETMQQLWAEVLRLPTDCIGIEDDFWSLGGNSIRAMKLAGVARGRGLILKAEDILDAGTLEEMAAYAGMNDLPSEVPPAFSLCNDESERTEVVQTLSNCQIKEDEIEDIYPCTHLQAGLFSLAVKRFGAYTICMEFELPANVEVERFQRAWEVTVEANPILRTRIVPGKDVDLWQAVIQDVIPWDTRSPGDNIPKQWRDWQPGKRLIRLAMSHPTTPSTPRHFTLLIHHALTDGWALPLLLQQVEAAYRGEKLPPRPFSPFVRYLTTQDQNEIDRHWAESLSDLNAATFPKLPSPGYVPNPTVTATYAMPIAAASNIEQINVPTKLELAWGLLLSQYTDSWDVVFGVTVAGRGAPVEGIESMTGPTIATIPMRLLLDRQATVADSLKTIQAQSIRTMSVEQAGLQRISRLGADLAASTQFQTLLVIQADEGEHRRPSLFSKLHDLTQPADVSSYGISVIAKPSSTSVELEITHDPLMVTDVQMKRLIHQLEHIYRQIQQLPNSRLEDIESISPSDMAELRKWNGQLPARAEQCAHELIYQRTLTQPAAPAVCAWDGKFSYKELEAHAENLARQLVDMGVGPEIFVPLYFEKSRWTTVAMLAVLKAGGAFAMLDPSHPMDRLQQICRETQGSILICSEANAAFARQLGQLNIVILGSNHNEVVSTGKSGNSRNVTPSNAMYAVFTSGSTGRPKGAVMTHGSWCTAAQAYYPKLHLGHGSRVVQFSAYAFDVSIADNLMTLVAGGCVCVPSDQDRLLNLTGAIADLEVNWACITPSVARNLSPPTSPTLKDLILCGEPMSSADVQQWSPYLHLMNGYGPAECAILVSLQENVIDPERPTNIGTVNGAVGWVVDPRNANRLSPVGAVGELFVEGPSTAQGYLNQPEKTAEAFIENPSWLRKFRDGTSRLYRTGDLVLYTDEGELKIVGRKDTQVKLRGQRVEMGEVEYHLRRCFPGAQGAVADVLPSQDGRAALLAGFVLRTPIKDHANLIVESDARFHEAAATALSQMRQALPPYMVPAVLIPLSRLPLSATGKLNRRDLNSQATLLSREQLDKFRMAEESSIREPETHIQTELRRLFGLVMSIPESQIGIEDDFFRRGGDSISAMKLVALAQKSGYSLTVRDIFTSPRIIDLAVKTGTVKETINSSVPPFSLVPDSQVQEEILSTLQVETNIGKDQIEDLYPCTPIQEGLMALTLKTPGKYVATFVYDLVEDVDLDRFQAAYDAAVAANPILRTRLTQSAGGSFQVVVREKPHWEKYRTEQDYADRSETPAMGPNTKLLRLSLIACPPRLVMDIHHALYDGWSLSLVWEQIEAAYREQGLKPRPFSPFIRYLQDQEDTASYWRSQFEDLNTAVFPILPYPTYEPAPNQVIHRQHSVIADVKLDFTMSTAVQLAWAIILSYYTDSNDVVFGLTLSGRTAVVSGIDQFTGPTVTTVPLRVRLDLDRSVQEEVHRIQKQVTDMTAYEQFGLRNIRSLSSDAAKACQFQSHLGVQPPTKPSNGTLATDFRSAHEDYGEFASYGFVLICHLVAGASESLDIVAQYDPKMLDADKAQRMVMQFEHVLDQILSHPEMSLRSLSAVSDHDWDQIARWNKALPPTSECCLHDSVLEHRIRRPSAPAVCAWDGDLTFEDLASCSLGLVQLLRDNGIQRGSIVPVCLEKSKWCIISMLAVLRSGATLVCIDPKLPTERLRNMLDQIKPQIAIGSTETKAKFEGLSATTILTVPVLVQVFRPSLTSAKDGFVDPKTPAFIVFTSGSTGRPKGIVMEHRNISTSIRDHSDALKITENSRVLHFASYAFDASIYEIFTTLVNGGCVCIPSESDRMNAIEQFIADKQVDVAILTPSMLAILDPDEVPTVRTVISGGEALTRHVASRWASRTTLINGYGPAETTICAAGPVVEPDWVPGTIGPVLGGLAWVTAPSDPTRLAPLGAVGELIIEGPVVTRGYMDSPELTRAGYIDAPKWLTDWRDGSPGRLYRSGDLVELTTGGAIRFIGRKDTQVKLRGQRIELAEVEYHVRRCSGGLDAIVDIATIDGSSALFSCIIQDTADENAEGGLFLPPTGTFQSSIQLAAVSLRDAIPEYMIPSVFLPISKAPQTTGGKVDRKALRKSVEGLSHSEIQRYAAAAQRSHRHPSTAREKAIHAVWIQVLNKTPDMVGVDDSFFHLGGDSINAMQIVSRLKGAGIRTTVDRIFQQSTIAKLAPTVESEITSSSESLPGEICDTPFRLSAIQQLFLDRVPANYDHFNQSFLFELQRPVQGPQVKEAIQWIVESHSMLRARFSRHADGSWYQAITKDVDNSYRCEEHENMSQRDAETMFKDHQKVLSIENGPLVAVDLMHMDSGKQWLSLIAHHLVVDIVSWQTILDQLERLLESKPVIPTSTMSYLTWSHLQEEHIVSNPEAGDQVVPTAMMDYWGMPETSNTYGEVDVYQITLDHQQTALLLGSANEVFNTRPVELLQGALMHAFVKTFPDRPTPVIFNEDHGRDAWAESMDVTGTVGWFTNVWPSHVPLDPDSDLIDAVSQTKDGRRDVQDRGLFFLEARQGRATPMEVLFNYTGVSEQGRGSSSLFKRAPVPISDLVNIGPNVGRFSLIEILAEVTDGKLLVQFIFNRRMRQAEKIIGWAERTQEALSSLAEQFPTVTPRLTRSDVPLLRLTDGQFCEFQAQVIDQLSLAEKAVADAYPCSPIQLGMLLSEAKNPEDYTNRLVWSIHAQDGLPVDTNRLIRAWEQVVKRHPLLRTVFVDSLRGDGNIDQVVLDNVHPNIVSLNLTDIENPVQGLSHWERSPMPVLHPLHRLTVCRAASGNVACALEINHALVDGISSQILFRDLLLAYDGMLPQGSDHVYRDYISYLLQQPSDPARTYWDTYTDNLEPCFFPKLISDSESTLNDGIGRVKRILIGPSSLREFCRLNEVTVASVFQLAWGLVLRAYASTEDVCYGYMTSGRDTPISGVEDAVGPFINMLVRRVNFKGDTSTIEMLRRSQSEFAQCLGFQYWPLAEIAHRHGILFNSVMSVQPVVASLAVPSSSLTFSLQDGEDPTEYDLFLYIGVDRDEIDVVMDYRRGLLTNGQATFVLDAFEQAVTGIVGFSDQPVRSVPLLGGSSHQTVCRWNEVPQAVEQCVGDMILDNYRAKPDSPAVCAWDGNFTYAELEVRSARLGRELHDRYGVGPEIFVPIYAVKSRWIIVAITAVIRAGGAFILLDPNNPLSRLHTMCTKSEATVILALPQHQETASKLASQVITFGEEALEAQDTCKADGRTEISTGLTPDNALYGIFTSGSTGQPKGVIIHHRAFATSAISQARTLGIGPQSRVLQSASFSFDVSVGEMLTTLIQGGCLCIPSEEQRQGGLSRAACELQANWAILTPSVARTLRPADFPTLRTLALIGEVVSSTEVQSWSQVVNLILTYGPAECTPWCTGTVERTHPGTDGRSLGRWFGCRIWLVDPQNPDLLVPLGAPGEIVIDGPIVGRGYLKDPATTQAVFLDHPQAWGEEISGSVYRTGDLARYNEDGTLQFVARKDLQVKLRGQRFELAEVEHHLRQVFGDAQDTFAEVTTTCNESKLLVAFIYAPDASAPAEEGKDALFGAVTPAFRTTVEEGETQLGTNLPGYMVPTLFLPLQHIPLTRSGKLDRRQLREAVTNLSFDDLQNYFAPVSARTMPSTSVEKRLQEIWSDVLNRPAETIGVSDSFFRLGGDSLGAMQVISQTMAAGFGIKMQHIFRLRTISALSSLVSESQPLFGNEESGSRDRFFPLSPGQQMLLELAPFGSGSFTQSVLLDLDITYSHSAVEQAVHQIVARHPMLCAMFRRTGDHDWEQTFTPHHQSNVRFQHTKIESLDAMADVIQQGRAALDIQTGPVFSVDLVQIAGESQRLFMVGHPLIVDRESWKIILEDLQLSLTAKLTAKNPNTSFLTWCERQSRCAQSGPFVSDAVVAQEIDSPMPLGYWGLQDQNNPYSSTFEAKLCLDRATTATLLGAANNAYRTKPEHLLQAAILQAFGVTFEDRSLPTVLTESHVRHSQAVNIDTDRTVGCFTSLSLIRIHGSDPHNILRQVKDRGCDMASSFGQSLPVELMFRFDEKTAFEDDSVFRPIGKVPEEHKLRGTNVLERLALIEVTVDWTQECLEVRFAYPQVAASNRPIGQWIDRCAQELRRMARELPSHPPQPTLSDLPLVSWKYSDLDEFLHSTLPQIGLSANDVQELYPCSPIQQGILLSQKREGDVYNIRFMLTVEAQSASSSVVADKLASAWNDVAGRHPMLRTCIVADSSRNGFDIQLVLQTIPDDIVTVLSQCPDPLQVLQHRPRAKFMPGRPPYKLTMCPSLDGRVIVALDISHVLIDGASLNILVRDLVKAYNGRLPVGAGPLYSAYMSYLQSLDIAASKEFWADYLRGSHPCLFPASKILTEIEPSHERSFKSFEFDLSSHAELQRLCANHDDFTFANVIHVAWGLVLKAYTGSDDVCFGYMTSGRDVGAVPGILDALGPFINILVCRLLLSQDTHLDRVVRQVQQDFLKSADHQHLPFSDIQRAADLPNIGLFNSLLSFEKQGVASDVGHDNSIRIAASGGDGSTEFDLSVVVSAEEHRTGIVLGYWSSFMSHEQAVMIADTFQQAIFQLTTSIGHKTVGQLDLLGNVGRAQIQAWNRSLLPRIDRCMHDLISERCAEQPNKPAVCSHDGGFTYGEIDILASELASHLICDHNIGPGFFVPVYFEKSRWAIVAMLAIMKAGAAFVLIDPAHPRQRVLEICGQTQSPLVVTSESRNHQAKGLASAVVVVGDRKMQWSAGYKFPLSTNSLSPDQPVYVIFTSGSTGKPKGAVVTHRSLCTSAMANIPSIGLDQSARVLNFSSFAFDASILEVLFTLLAGGCVCVISDEERVGDLSGAINRLDVNLAYLTPSVARILNPLHTRCLKVLGLVGEAIAPGDISKWKPWVRLLNLYGPAECSIMATVCAAAPTEHDSTNIGKSYAAICWITTAEDPERLAPVGAIGELIIEGDIVGAGYLNDKDKTQAAFISPPTWLCRLRAPGNPGPLYRTGDLVQYEPTDGTIRYIGRKDTQVKLRGQRIELGEIENQLRRAISDTGTDVVAEVVELTEQPSSSVLIAFMANPRIKANSGSIFGTADQSFRDTITATITQLDLCLPIFMVPSVFIPLQCIPLTKTGKVDRRALREAAMSLPKARLAELTLPFADATKQPPSTPAECAFQRLFADLFGRDEMSTIGRHDHFFRLGGDSIRAMTLIPGAREAGYTITMVDIFKNPRLCDLAQAARAITLDTSAPLAPFALISQSTDLIKTAAEWCSVSPAQIEDIYPCTPVQEGLMALSTKSADSINNYKVTFNYQLDSAVDLGRFRSSWNSVVAANPILRTRMVQSDRHPGTFQVVLADSPSFHQFNDSEEHRKHTSTRKMVLGQELVDFALVLPSSGPRHFHLTLHHALYDGWTISSLWKQVQDSYENPHRALIPRPFNRFIEYAGNQADAAAQYWRDEFLGLAAPAWPSLPTARHVPAADASVHHTINHIDWKDTSDYTATTLIHLAWALVMSCHTDSDDLVYGVTLNGRSAPVIGIEETTGPTIATFPLRVKLGLDRDTVEDTLSSIQQQAATRMPFQHFGLQNIRHASTEASQACQFQCHLGIQSFSSSQAVSELVTELPSDHNDYAAFAEYAILLICHLDETSPSKIDVVMNYDQQVIPSRKAKRIIGLFAHLLQQLPKNLGTPLNQLDLLSPEDKNQLLLWNRDIPPSYNVCLHDLVLTHAAAAPNSAAVSAWDGDLTYSQLQVLSGQLAGQLSRLGVRPGTLVPICFKKSKWAVITMLGVLRAGGACVPLDPSHPAQHIESIIRRSNAKLVLASPQTQSFIPAQCHGQVRTVPFEGLAAHATAESWPQPTFANTAFVIFTSGSTGQPKGILMEHSNLCTSIRDHGPPMRINSSTRALHFASYAFDASIYELFSVLANGGCVCIPSDSDRLSNLAGFICDAHINYAIFTPSILNRVLRPEQVPGLQTVTLGGEAVTQDVVDVWASHLTLINGYGPAEATICAAGVIDPASWTAGTIGPVTGGLGWITMPSDVSRLAPVGAVGELLIEGPVVTRGYLADAERTSAAYIPSPAWLTRLRTGQKPGRLYRTGDLVQYTDDGGIRYIGRKDTQIKLRGQRVELSHVEHHVRLCFPEAAEIVAEIALRDGTPTMVAFIAQPNLQNNDEKQALFRNPSAVFQAQVQSAISRLKSSLPVYMVPSVFLHLARVPRTNSDKIDRRELREQAARLSRDQVLAFSTGSDEKGSTFRLPRTARERLFQELWGSVLNLPVDAIAVNDDFFNLGGDSIMGMKLASLLRRRGLSLDVSDIFAQPVLAEQALHARKFIDQTAVESYDPGSLLGIKGLQSFVDRQLEESFLSSASRPFQSSEVEDIFPTTEFQHQFLESSQISYQQFLLPVKLDLGRLEHSCRVLVHRHPMLRSVFLPYHDGYLQVVLRHPDVRVIEISCDEDLAPFIERLCEKDASNGVSWGTPYFQVFLVSRSPSESALLLRTSHAQYDGESLPLMLQDLVSSYEGTPLEEAPPSFPLYLRYRQTQANPDAYRFWKQYLQDAEMTNLGLPRPASAPDIGVVRKTDPCLIRLPMPPRGITISSLVKAAWAIVLAQTTGHRDLVFGHVINGRDAPLADVHAISGPCVTISPIRIKIPSSNEVLDFLRHVQAQYTRAMPYANIDFGAIRQNATSWDPTVSFDSLVTHQGANWSSNFKLNGQECTYNPIIFGGTPFFHVVTMPFQGQLRVQLFGPSQRVSSLDLKQLSDRFCSILGDLDEGIFPSLC